MDPVRILQMQFAISLVAYTVLYLWFIGPWLRTRPLRDALMILVFPHLFRHLGSNLLVPGLVSEDMPESFAMKTALGDLLTVVLAFCALCVLRFEWKNSIAVVWLFNIVGFADLILNLIRAARMEVAPQLGAAWYVPAYIVPGMLVVHIAIFSTLVKRAGNEKPDSVQAGQAPPD